MVSNNPATADTPGSKLRDTDCEVFITPSSVAAKPGDTVEQFTAETICSSKVPTTPVYTWEFDFGCIGSTCDPIYKAGEPAPGDTTCTDQITATDTANGDISGTATVVVSISSSTTTTTGPCTLLKIYGEDSREVETLRYLRDNILSQSPTGQELVKLYYQLSPAIVKAMKKDKELKEEIKEMIDGVLMLIGVETE